MRNYISVVIDFLLINTSRSNLKPFEEFIQSGILYREYHAYCSTYEPILLSSNKHREYTEINLFLMHLCIHVMYDLQCISRIQRIC